MNDCGACALSLLCLGGYLGFNRCRNCQRLFLADITTRQVCYPPRDKDDWVTHDQIQGITNSCPACDTWGGWKGWRIHVDWHTAPHDPCRTKDVYTEVEQRLLRLRRARRKARSAVAVLAPAGAGRTGAAGGSHSAGS